jgi:nucleotide-binding universal stress UspA family protein
MSEKMKLLIAYDGSSCADAALDDLQRAGLPQAAEALIMSVADVFLPPLSSPEPAVPAQGIAAVQRARAQAAHAMEEAHTLALQAHAQVLTSFPDWDVEVETCADSPAWAVIKKVDTWQPDLVVVGSHGRSAMGRLLLGSVSHKILAEAQCSVRIGRSRSRTAEAPVRLLIGVDGSPDAEAAVRAVARREWPAGSAARLVTVLDARLFTALAFMPPEARAIAGDEDAQTWASKMIEAMAEPLRTRGLVVSSVITEGDPKHVLLNEAEHWEADCIFTGARGHSRIERFMIGSVSAAVAAQAPCSVEVVRPRPPL